MTGPEAEKQVVIPPQSDAETVRYFDSHVPEYSDGRLDRVAEFLATSARPDSTLIDVGCGVGNTLDFISRSADMTRLSAMDVSESCLVKTRERVECDTLHGSVLDRDFIAGLAGGYDFVVVAAVLHHLVGSTRRESRANAREAIGNSLMLLKPEGHLIIVEPVFRPRLAMDSVFWLKRTVSRVTSRRVGVLGYWANVGQPVVSYYSPDELNAMVIGEGGSIEQSWLDGIRLPMPLRLIFKRHEASLIVGSS